MPYITDDIKCADIDPAESFAPDAYCQYLIQDQELYLCEKNTQRPYYIMIKAGRGEEIVVMHVEKLVNAMTQHAGLPERLKSDYALAGSYKGANGERSAAVIFVEIVDNLNSEAKFLHKVEQCNSANQFFCKNEQNFQNYHANLPRDIYRAFGEFRTHKVFGAIVPQKYNIARGKPVQVRMPVYQLDSNLFIDRRSQKARVQGRNRNVNFERPRAITFQELLDAMGVTA